MMTVKNKSVFKSSLNFFQLIIFFITIGIISNSFAAVENLDELINRKTRHESANFNYVDLEDPSNHYYWQPETFSYKDVSTGKEVWKLSSTNGLKTMFHNSLGASPWSADGKRMAFSSSRTTGAYQKSPTTSAVWMVADTDGTKLRNVVNGVKREYWGGKGPYWSWSPVEPDVSYDFSSSKHGQSSVPNMLYKGIVNDTSDSRSEYLQFPNTHGPLYISKSIGDDGKTLIAYAADESWLYPANILSGSKGFVINGTNFVNGLTTNRAHGATVEERTYWGSTIDNWSGNLHGFGFHGPLENSWIHVMPSGSAGAFWKYNFIGSDTDHSGMYIHDPTWDSVNGYQWGGEGGPLWTPGGGKDPWLEAENSGADVDWAANPSHASFGRWGRIAFFNATDKGAYPSIYDVKTHKFIGQWKDGDHLHGTNRAWSDIAVASYGYVNGNFNNMKIKLLKYNNFETSIDLCSTHTLYNNDGIYAGASYEYDSISRPSLSPDGTKVGFHSTFLNSTSGSYDDKPDVYYVVAYYPYPPEITQVTFSNGIATISFDWRLKTTPRGYTSRGWPDESTDDPSAPRETKEFRLWRSLNGTSDWVHVKTIAANPFDKFDYVNGGLKSGQVEYWEVTDTPEDGTWFYAVTSIEHSGLESRTLSNIFDTSGQQTSAYPSIPGGVNQFYFKAPPFLILFEYEKMATDGHYRLTWIESMDPMVRYYNIYYSTTGTPDSIQQNRIASIPKGSSNYVDWLANPSTKGYYTITSVDYQGNESYSTPGTPAPPGAPGDLKIIK